MTDSLSYLRAALALAADPDPDTLPARIVRAFRACAAAERALLFLPAASCWRVGAAGDDPAAPLPADRLPQPAIDHVLPLVEASARGRAVARRALAAPADASTQPREQLCLPLAHGDLFEGVLWLERQAPAAGTDDTEALALLAAHGALALANAHRYQARSATEDSLRRLTAELETLIPARAAEMGMAITRRREELMVRPQPELAPRAEHWLAEAIIAHAPVGIQVFDRNGTSVMMNEANRRLLGLRDTSYGIGAFNALRDPFMLANGSAALFARAYAGEVVQMPEFTVDFADPSNTWDTAHRRLHFDQILFPIRDAEDQVAAVVSYVLDITARRRVEKEVRRLNAELEQQVEQRTAQLATTIVCLEREIAERRRTEEQLRESQTLLQSIIDYAPAAIVVQRAADGRYTLVNWAALVEFGKARAEASGQTIDELFPPASAELRAAENARIIANKTALQEEYTLPDRSGNPRTYLGVKFPIYDADGQISAIGGIYTDITERKRIADELRASEEKYRLLFENSMDAILIADDDGSCVQANNAACRLLGLPREQVQRMSVSDLLGVAAPSPDARYPQDEGAVFETGEITVQRPDGQACIADYVACCIAPHLHLSILRDVTERRRAEAQLREQMQALGILRERERLARELHDSVGQVLGYANTQAQAARDFLATGRVPMASACLTSLVAVVQEAQADVRAFILGARAPQPGAMVGDTLDFPMALHRQVQSLEQIYGLRVERRLAPEAEGLHLPPLAKVQLLRIVQEALTNVYKHAGVSSAALDITLHDGQLRLTVHDEGRGFDPALVAGASPAAPGFGIQAMRSRADEIGATLQITTTPDTGTSVTIDLPLRAPEHHIAHTRVLLVDDSPIFAEGLRQLLIARGFAVVGMAANGRIAIEQARALQPDLVLMDVEMPELNGLDATVAILRELPATRVVMLTVAEDPATLFEALRRGASGYLLKSLDADDLCDHLAGLTRGEVALSSDLALQVLRELSLREPAAEAPDSPADLAAQLTPQQVKALTLLAQGHTYKAIGHALGYSERAIKYHIGNAIRVLHLKDRASAVAFTREQMRHGRWPHLPEKP